MSGTATRRRLQSAPKILTEFREGLRPPHNTAFPPAPPLPGLAQGSLPALLESPRSSSSQQAGHSITRPQVGHRAGKLGDMM